MLHYALFLDDNRTLQKAYEVTKDSCYIDGEWHIVRNYDEFTSTITDMFKLGYFPIIVSFDHDLHPEHTKYYFDNGGHENPPDPANATFINKTGLDCAKWLVSFCIINKVKTPQYKVHSKNPFGKKHIIDYLNKNSV